MVAEPGILFKVLSLSHSFSSFFFQVHVEFEYFKCKHDVIFLERSGFDFWIKDFK